MNLITFVIRIDGAERARRVTPGNLFDEPVEQVTLVIDQVDRFQQPSIEDYEIRILGPESSSHDARNWIRISDLVNVGQVNVQLLDQDNRQIEVDRDLL